MVPEAGRDALHAPFRRRYPNVEMEVRAGTLTGIAAETDLLAGLHLVARFNKGALVLKMYVIADTPVFMQHKNVVCILCIPA